MSDWQSIFRVDLVGTAMLVESLRPLVSAGTAVVCFASMAPVLGVTEPHPAADAALDEPLHPDCIGRVRDALGAAVEQPGIGYAWAKRGVQRLVRQEAVRLGPAGARICSVSPGLIDTPMGRQEADSQPFMAALLQQTPSRQWPELQSSLPPQECPLACWTGASTPPPSGSRMSTVQPVTSNENNVATAARPTNDTRTK